MRVHRIRRLSNRPGRLEVNKTPRRLSLFQSFQPLIELDCGGLCLYYGGHIYAHNAHTPHVEFL